jgi:hypothetical protein
MLGGLGVPRDRSDVVKRREFIKSACASAVTAALPLPAVAKSFCGVDMAAGEDMTILTIADMKQGPLHEFAAKVIEPAIRQLYETMMEQDLTAILNGAAP